MHWLEGYDVALRQLHWSLVEDMRLDMGGTDAIVLFMAPMPTTGVPSTARAVPKAARQPGRFYMQTQHTAFQFRQPPISIFAFPSAQKKKSDFPSTPPRLEIDFLGGPAKNSLPPSSHQLDSWLAIADPPSVQWPYEASYLDVPSTAMQVPVTRLHDIRWRGWSSIV